MQQPWQPVTLCSFGQFNKVGCDDSCLWRTWQRLDWDFSPMSCKISPVTATCDSLTGEEKTVVWKTPFCFSVKKPRISKPGHYGVYPNRLFFHMPFSCDGPDAMLPLFAKLGQKSENPITFRTSGAASISLVFDFPDRISQLFALPSNRPAREQRRLISGLPCLNRFLVDRAVSRAAISAHFF